MMPATSMQSLNVCWVGPCSCPPLILSHGMCQMSGSKEVLEVGNDAAGAGDHARNRDHAVHIIRVEIPDDFDLVQIEGRCLHQASALRPSIMSCQRRMRREPAQGRDLTLLRQVIVKQQVQHVTYLPAGKV